MGSMILGSHCLRVGFVHFLMLVLISWAEVLAPEVGNVLTKDHYIFYKESTHTRARAHT